jgi:amidase
MTPISSAAGAPIVSDSRGDIVTKLDMIGRSVRATAAAIVDRSISVQEVIEHHLAWMARVNPALNAVTVDLSVAARATAERADAQLRSGGAVGALHGVPVTIKENVDQAGLPTPNGIPAYAGLIAPEDSPVVRNLLDAGAIVIGRSNTPEFSFRITTDNPLRGRTRNPWTDAITCGGSSGGAGAAVAAGIGCIAHGNDIGGSLRYPAYCNGVATIRPTIGRVPAFNPSQLAERPYLMQMMSVQGPMARSVADVRLALQVMARRDPRDPLWTPAPFEGPRLPQPMRIALLQESCGLPVDEDVAAALARAAEILREAGYVVEEVAPPCDMRKLLQVWFAIIFTEMHVLQEPAMRPVASPEMNSLLDAYLEVAGVCDLAGYLRALTERQAALRLWLLFQEHYPLALCPVSLQKPVAPGADLGGAASVRRIFDSCLYLPTMNLLGLPGAVVPVARAGRIPLGVQLVGQRYREDLCLDAAEAIERATGVMTDSLLAELKGGGGGPTS